MTSLVLKKWMKTFNFSSLWICTEKKIATKIEKSDKLFGM